MSWNHGENSWTPLLARLVDIRVANARVGNRYFHIGSSGLSTLKSEWDKGRSSG
jgi:hypothetical protein